MPSVSTIRPLQVKLEHRLSKLQSTRPFVRKTEHPADTVRFGGGKDLLHQEKFSFMDRLKLFGKTLISKNKIKGDLIWTVAGTALCALMPPHIQAIPMLPMVFAGFRLLHAVPALFSPKAAADALKKVSQKT